MRDLFALFYVEMKINEIKSDLSKYVVCLCYDVLDVCLWCHL